MLRLEPLQTHSPYGNKINVDWQRSLNHWSPGNGPPKIDLTWRTFENWTYSRPEDDMRIPESSAAMRSNWENTLPPTLNTFWYTSKFRDFSVFKAEPWILWQSLNIVGLNWECTKRVYKKSEKTSDRKRIQRRLSEVCSWIYDSLTSGRKSNK